LNKCEDPVMLRQWEVNTPQIVGETGEIWMKFIKRDVPNWRNKRHEPKNPRNWYKVYRKLKAEADEEERQAEELLKEKMSKIRKDEDSWKVAAPTKAIPPTGRNKAVAMQFQRGSDNNGLRFTTGTKTKDFMSSVRRQAAESKLQKTGVLARPTNTLHSGTPVSKIAQAPRYMVEDRQRQAELARKSPPRTGQAAAFGKAAAAPMSLAARAAHDLKVREERLRAVREGRALPGHTTASSPEKSSTTPQGRGPMPRAKGSSTNERQAGRSEGGTTSGKRQLARNGNTDDMSDDAGVVPSTEKKGLRKANASGPTSSSASAARAMLPKSKRTPTPPLAPGVKRKAGPTILLESKRKKR
jgi:elongin-A